MDAFEAALIVLLHDIIVASRTATFGLGGDDFVPNK